MNLPHTLAALLSTAFIIAIPAWAGEGHDHGAAASASESQALPRFTAVSEDFELVGVLSGKQITLYLDRFADNRPVRDAQIELEVGSAKFKAEKHGEDEYEIVLPEVPKAGVLPVTAIVTAGNESDLLAGELDIHDDSHSDEVAYPLSWKVYAGWLAVGIAGLVLLVWASRRMMGTRSVRAGDVA